MTFLSKNPTLVGFALPEPTFPLDRFGDPIFELVSHEERRRLRREQLDTCRMDLSGVRTIPPPAPVREQRVSWWPMAVVVMVVTLGLLEVVR